MACTIDHLHEGHRVAVLREFTDLNGTTLRAGDTGILRGLDADLVRMEIGIGLEREGTTVRLRFALRAPDGPRVGRMKEYFEVGECADPAPGLPPVLVEAAPLLPPILPRAGPARPPAPGPAPVPAPAPAPAPQESGPPGERRVSCDCPVAFHRDLLPAGANHGVTACLACGTVTCSSSFGDDGRFTGNAWQVYRAIPLPEPVLRWLSGWPRVLIDHTRGPLWPMSAHLARYPTLHYPADTRCTDPSRLAALEARLARDQASLSPAERLRATHQVRKAPPAGLPDDLVGYALIKEALSLRPGSDLSRLLELARPGSPAKDLAAELIGRRPDAADLVLELLGSADGTRHGTGYIIARDLRPVDPRLTGFLIGQLNSLSFDRLPDVPQGIVSRGRAERILLLIADLRLSSPEMIATLRTLMRRFGRYDDFLARCTRTVLGLLASAESPSPP